MNSEDTKQAPILEEEARKRLNDAIGSKQLNPAEWGEYWEYKMSQHGGNVYEIIETHNKFLR